MTISGKLGKGPTGLYNKLAFTGFRIFLLEPPNWNICQPGSAGMLSYYDIDKNHYAVMAETLGGYFPAPEEFASIYAQSKAKLEKIKYRAAFVNNERYELLWMAPFYKAIQEASKPTPFR